MPVILKVSGMEKQSKILSIDLYLLVSLLLKCDLHKCFPVVFHPLIRAERLKEAGVMDFPFLRLVRLQQNSCNKALITQFLLKSGLVKENRIIWAYLKMNTFFPIFFSYLHCKILVGFAEVKLTNVWAPPPQILRTTGIFYC